MKFSYAAREFIWTQNNLDEFLSKSQKLDSDNGKYKHLHKHKHDSIL